MQIVSHGWIANALEEGRILRFDYSHKSLAKCKRKFHFPEDVCSKTTTFILLVVSVGPYMNIKESINLTLNYTGERTFYQEY